MNGKERENSGIKFPEQINFRGGVSLKELLPFIVQYRRRKRPGGISRRYDKIIWIAEAIETEDFWLSLNHHLFQDARNESRRHSLGGVFRRQLGEEPLGPYTWSQVFTCFDHFLKQFDMRATEFLFHDFRPQNSDRHFVRIISATRELALNKYPRLRKLYWEDYQEALEKPDFWRFLIADLSAYDSPVAVNTFFNPTTRSQLGINRRLINPQRSLFSQLWRWVNSNEAGGKARFVEYSNFTQIIRDVFGQDPRTFLLDFVPRSPNPLLGQTIEQAKALLTEKILPLRVRPEPKEKMERKELREIVASEEFWRSLLISLNAHAHSQKQAYSFSFFLRHYDWRKNEILTGHLGSYGRLVSAFSRAKNFSRENSRWLSQRLVQFLMWEFQPPEEIADLVMEAKAVCAEMFPQDCLYVSFQTPQFWKKFEEDVRSMRGRPTLASFFRYFSSGNPDCNPPRHRRGSSIYQRFYHRTYHKQEEFLQFLRRFGIKDVADYKEGFTRLLWQTAPASIKALLLEKFPHEFQSAQALKRKEESQLFLQAKSVIMGLSHGEEPRVRLEFSNNTEAKRFRAKLHTAARSLKVRMISGLRDACLNVRLGQRIRFPSKEERARFESQIQELKAQGLLNREIAVRLGVEDYHIEYVSSKLGIKRRTISKADKLDSRMV